MDKNAIKKYAVWARNELIARVAQKANQYGITEAEIISASADSIHGKLLTPTEKKQRTALIEKIKTKGYKQVIEEVAYTWFNRLTAIRFMEVNGYLPSHVRVFTDEENRFAPQILAQAIHLDMPGLNMDKVYELKQANKTEELYKYLLITQCNALNEILPGMFQRIEDYTELLLPDNLLREGSVIEQMISLIPEEDWTDQVQIIGWLYQFYNAEPKDVVFANLKKNVKISKENIPAATQLFTPDWIVRYMVENSLGRLWVEGHPNDELKANWKYYLDEAEQEESARTRLETIRKEYAGIKPEEIKVIDPCMGSGHILCYMFDVLVQIYEAYGYTARDAASSIVENNIYGLDIDDRASQLAYFAVMMKARQYDRRFFTRHIVPNVMAIEESNEVSYDIKEYFANGSDDLKEELDKLIKTMKNAKEYGSITIMGDINFDILFERLEEIEDDVSLFSLSTISTLRPIIKCAFLLYQKYDVLVTNPPYMGSDSMSATLKDFVLSYYPDSRYDLYACCVERFTKMITKRGLIAMITQHSFMYAYCFRNFRQYILQNTEFRNAIHLGARAFEEISGEVVQCIAFTLSKNITGANSVFVPLDEYSNDKESHFHTERRLSVKTTDFASFDNSIFAYSLTKTMKDLYVSSKKVGDVFDSKAGVVTGNDEYFLRYWFEVPFADFDTNATDTTSKYVPYSKGGTFVKWYGNIPYALKMRDLYNNALVNKSVRRGDINAYYQPCIGWSQMGGGNEKNFSYLSGCVCGTATPTILHHDLQSIYYTLGFLNTKIPSKYIKAFNPLLSTYIGDICNLPYVTDTETFETVVNLVAENIEAAKLDGASFENTWDFAIHPLIKYANSLWDATAIGATMSKFYGRDIPKPNSPIELCYLLWKGECAERFATLKANEEELNRLFIDIYGLNDELSPEIADKDITVRNADLARDIRSFISYAVGCMFGRYSLDIEGIAYAGGEWDESKYTTFRADKDNVLPICDDEYFEDDIVGKFVRFVETVYGKDTLEENLKFISDALGGSGSPRDVIRSYFLNEFYADHVKMYQKRPIYWQFDSGKKNGFKCLIYMHRYQPDTIARIRTDYVHEQQARYRTAIADLEQRIQVASTSERVKLTKLLQKLKDQETEIRLFEEKVHHLADQMIRIDLDDGVKHNYEIFKDVLTKLK